MADIALKIRRNAEQHQEAINELLKWEKEMAAKDEDSRKKLASGAVLHGTSFLPPVRSESSINSAKPADPSPIVTSETTDKDSKASKLKAWDYRAWDKFDVDKAVEEVDYQPAKPSSGKNAHKSGLFAFDDDPELDPATIEEALVEKEKGNEYFKRKDYKKAIECYSKSRKLNPNDVIPIVNRAMAHLKLENWKEAESDCTLGLKIQPKNVKALWRRGIARRELGNHTDARKDLQLAAVLEPTNASIKQDLELLENQESSKAKPAEKQSEKQHAASSDSAPRRRRLQIHEVGEITEETPAENASPSVVVATAAPPVQAATVEPDPVAARKASPAAEQPTIEIQHKQLSTKNEIPTKAAAVPETSLATQSPPRTASSTNAASPPKSPKHNVELAVPTSMYEFERDWNSIKTDLDRLYVYLKAIAPSNLPKIFGSSLEIHYVTKIIEILHKLYIPNESKSDIYLVLLSITSIERFAIVTMFMSRGDKLLVSELLAHIAGGEGVTEQGLLKIKTAFKIK